MANVKVESFGKLSDGREATLYTLRNSKGNELKVTNYGARIVSVRFRNKDFQNKFMLKGYSEVAGYENDETTGVVLIDDTKAFNKVFWDAEKIIEGMKLTAQIAGKHVEIIYSISNDNEVSITYNAKGVDDISTQLIFNAEALPNADIKVYDAANSKGKIAGQNVYSIIDEPAVVEMEVGMFGYDPGCPIDWIDTGLKNAADIVSHEADITLNIFATQNNLCVEEVEGGFAIKTGDTNKNENGEIKAQTIYVFKNRD